MQDLKKHFISTYTNNSWGSSETRSGPGSEINSSIVKETIELVLYTVNNFYNDQNILSISDIPCGDFNFVNVLLESILKYTNVRKIIYYAYDIVDDLQNVFENMKKIDNVEYHFNVLDITKEIPIKTDIILCKELFIHLSFKDISSSIENFKKSGSSHLIINNFYNGVNIDIEYSVLGECREVYLLEPPISLPSPLYIKNSYCLWDLYSDGFITSV